MKAIYAMMAAYNGWANERLYAAAAQLSDDEYRADLGAFFGSVHGTLNHILVADRIWMRRFTGEGQAPMELNVILFDDLPGLHAARRAEDKRIAGYVASLDEATLQAPFGYRTISKPVEIAQPLAQALTHFFNHQTHHRGQVHALLTRLRGDAPSLDLIMYQREAGMVSMRAVE